MKKTALALLFVVAMLCCVVSATAAVPDRFVPATVADVPYLPSVPQVPTFTLTTVDDHYVLETDWTSSFNSPRIEMFCDGSLSSTVEFTFDSTLDAWVSNTILPEDDRNLLCFWDGFQNNAAYSQVYIYANSGEVRDKTHRLQVGDQWTDQYEYVWDADSNLVAWHDFDNTFVSCEYDTSGNLLRYTYTADDGANVNYMPDGNLWSLLVTHNSIQYMYLEQSVGDGSQAGWNIFDMNTFTFIPCNTPEGIDMANYPPLLSVTPPAVSTPDPSDAPSDEPTAEPTQAPSGEPTAEPTQAPTAEPTQAPSGEPTAEPTQAPTTEPTAEPTAEPTPEPTAEPTATPSPTPAPTPKLVWYGDNTMGVAGISLRDTYEGLTDKWYNVVPVDLTRDGVQTFTLVASNLFYIGEVAVVVDGDNITTYYALADGHGYVKGECLQWFTSPSDITSAFLDSPSSDLAFGAPISRAEVLDNADVGILFICNRVTYRQPYKGTTGYLTRYWPNHPDWVAYREQLMTIMPE